MNEHLEETSFDYIVLGTGLIESVLAGSLARVGKKVLHLDSHQNYGGNWAVFGFRELVQWYLNRKQETTSSLEVGEFCVDYERSYASNFRHVDLKLYSGLHSGPEPEYIQKAIEEGTLNDHIPKASSASDQLLFDAFFKDALTSQDSKDKVSETLSNMDLFLDLLKVSRSYNLDTTPKLLGAREELVETLIRSGVGRYLEFKNVDDIFIYDKTTKYLEKVPSSKEDVFTNKSVTLIEKRKLMKFLTFAMEYQEEDPLLEGTESMSYCQFLQDKFKISGKLQEAIVYAIALANDKVSVKSGLENTHKFVLSMGRFGKGAYLCPLYGGASEIAQAFCRVCAVYGGTYILNQPLEKFVVDSKANECTGIITKEGQEYKCNKLISGIDYLTASWLPAAGEELGSWVSRAIIVTDSRLGSIALQPYASEALSYSVFPPGSEAGNTDEPIYGIHQSEESMACPKGYHVTYLWTASKSKNVLRKAVDLLLMKEQDIEESQKVALLFTVFYEQRVRKAKDLNSSWKLPKNIIPCSDPDVSLDFSSATEEAQSLFYECESTEAEFMPAAEQEPEDDF